MIKIILAIIFIFAPASVFASDALYCCDLRASSPESNPLLRNFPELQVSSPFALQSVFPAQVVARATDPLHGARLRQSAYIDQEIAFFQTAFKERFEKYLARSGRYLPMVRKVMKESDVHEDIAYLPLIESGFNPMAVSRAKAAGLWQFMTRTAKHYGLRVDQWIDERYDAVKSTKAAMEYFKDLYRMFGSWPLSMASYNAGEGRIGRTLASTGATDYWELKEMGRMPKETRDYVPKFMASAMIAKDPEAYGFSVSYEEPVLYDEVLVPRQTSLLAISRATGVSLADIKAYNPELRKHTTPPNYPSYLLKLPAGKRDAFLENRSEIPLYKMESVRPKKTRTSIKRVKKTVSQSKKKFVAHKMKKQKQVVKAKRQKKSNVARAGRSVLTPKG